MSVVGELFLEVLVVVGLPPLQNGALETLTSLDILTRSIFPRTLSSAAYP